MQEHVDEQVTETDETTVAATEDAAPVKTRRTKAEAKTSKYTVIGGAISPNGGGRDSLVHPGSVVELTDEQARHYNKLGYLKPYIAD